MSIYENRLEPVYRHHSVSGYAQNQYILRWWRTEYDALLKIEIERWGWAWYWSITDVLQKAIPKETLEQWRTDDPLCDQYAWYNILMNFAVARAGDCGLFVNSRHPKSKICLLCNADFVEDSLPYPIIRRLGIDKLDYCAPCMKGLVYENTGSETSTEQEIKEYLLSLSKIIGRVPPQGFGEGINDLIELDADTLKQVIFHLTKKPTTSHIKGVYRSWLNALIQAGVLEDGTRKTARGTQTLAIDGHVCFSLGEKTIDDYLFQKGIQHQKEPRYPEGNFRADFLAGNVFIEYFGLAGNSEYDEKTQMKQQICKRNGIELISIYPTDLMSNNKLESKLRRLCRG
jgi:hypothetical protein